MRLALILGTLSAALCLASAVGQSEAPTKSAGYPKKVTTLKKRPTKTPSTAATLATTTKPSKPRVKIASKATTLATTTTTKAPALTALADASFSNLPADDLEFIKELDKQFKLHGNKIKIKVERDNSTSSAAASGKTNSKRTIDGELGYGYAHPGYDYTPPKFMFYPYSQHDIPATESPDIYTGYSPAEYESPRETTQPQQQVTSVTIEPSYSYELKPQTSYESQPSPVAEQQHVVHPEQPQIDLPQPQPQQHESSAPAEDAGGYQEPVIVLRIPGPAKYAAHLQTLLQQYLEIRAAQYLQLLQEAEQRKQQQQHQHQHQQQHLQQEEQLAPQPYATPEQHEQAHYHPDVSYAHQLAPTPPPVQYGPIDDVYHTYKGRHQQQAQYEQPALPESYYTPSAYQVQPQPQFYYAQPAQQAAAYEHGYQPHVYLIAMAPQAQYAQEEQQHQQQPQQQPIYVPEHDAPSAPAAEPATGHELPITENNPRPTHTKVIFNSASHGGGDYAAPMYDLPSIQQQYHEVAEQSHQADSSVHVADVGQPADDYQPVQSSGESIASVTQPPYNYHAHGLKMPHRQLRQGKRAANAEQAADSQLQQIREYVREKLGAEMGSAVEYKTTQLLEG